MSRIIASPAGLRAIFLSLAISLSAAAAAAQDPPTSFAGVARRVEPAVVHIEAKGKTPEPVAKGTPKPGDSDDIIDFFRRQMPQRAVYQVGSGFIVDKAGYIVTNNHVVTETSRLTVKLDSGEEYPARVVGVDDETDIAVLKIDAGKDLPTIKWGDSTRMEIGDWVLAMGSPFGLAKSVSAGIISQTRRDTPGGSAFQRFIQTDAVINPGNSGGPLVNMAGEVIGVNSQIATQTGEYSGVSFALPSSETRAVYDQIVSGGKVRRGYLGAFLDTVKVEFAKVYGLSEPRGAFITDIRDKQGPAALAGLRSGDIILEFNGQAVESAQDLIAKVAATPPAKAIAVNYLRDNGGTLEKMTSNVTLGERPSRSIAANEDRRTLPLEGQKPEDKPFGLTLADLTPTLAETYGLNGQKGIVVREINPASFIADVRASTGEQALSVGDLIQSINRKPVGTLQQFVVEVAKLKAGDAVVLRVVDYNPAIDALQTKFVQFTVR